MPIDVQGNFLKTTETEAYVVEDIYVKGGYRVVTVDQAIWNAANGNSDDQLYQSALADEAVSGTDGSLKVGCLVFDTTSSRNFRCTNLDPVTFIEVFANNGDVDTTAFVQRSELPQDANGAIDIASEATLQEALLSGVRVSGTSQAPTVNLSFSEDYSMLDTDPPFRWVVTLADPSTDPPTPAHIGLRLNPNAENPFTV